jgi:hypothetical protein
MTKTEIAPPLCAQCGEKPARRYVNAGRRMSPYCSAECGRAAKVACGGGHEAAAATKREALLTAAAAAAEEKQFRIPDGFFPATTNQQDWRDSQFNPMG